jgi:hypothetical protein
MFPKELREDCIWELLATIQFSALVSRWVDYSSPSELELFFLDFTMNFISEEPVQLGQYSD